MTSLVSPGFRSPEIRPVGFRDIRAGGAQPVSGAIAWYRFDEGSGQTLHDYSGNGNHGMLGSTSGVDTNDPSWSPQGLVFGGDDFVNCGNIAALNTGDSFTISFVAQITTPTNCVFSKQTSSSSGAGKAGIYVNSEAGRISAYIFDLSGTRWSFSSGVYPIGGFVCGAFRYDGSTLSLYINSIFTGSISTRYAPALDQNLHLGKYSYASGVYYIGTQSDFIIHPFALSPTQIAQNYTYIKYDLAKRGVILP